MVDRTALVAEMPPLRRFTRALTRDADEADDLAQATLERALARLGTLRDADRLRSWLFRIAYNLHINERTRRARRPDPFDPMDENWTPSVEGRQVERLEALSVLDALAMLPADQRAAIALTAVEDLTYREAAETLDIPLGTLMSRLHRGRQRLRVLTGQIDGSGDAAPRLRRVT